MDKKEIKVSVMRFTIDIKHEIGFAWGAALNLKVLKYSRKKFHSATESHVNQLLNFSDFFSPFNTYGKL